MSPRLNLLRALLVREIRAQYLDSVGGLLWALALPLLQLAVYAFVFTKIFQMRWPGVNNAGFVAYLAVAMWPWNAFAESLTRATSAVTDNEALIGKVALPKEVLVAAGATAPFLINLIGYAAVLLLLALTGTPINPLGLILMVPVLVAVYMFTLGLSLLAAATQVFIRDLRHALAALLLMWFFATPILYSLAMVPERYHLWYYLNPFTHVVALLRSALLPGPPVSMLNWSVAIVALLPPLILWLGYRYFIRLAGRFEDFL